MAERFFIDFSKNKKLWVRAHFRARRARRSTFLGKLQNKVRFGLLGRIFYRCARVSTRAPNIFCNSKILSKTSLPLFSCVNISKSHDFSSIWILKIFRKNWKNHDFLDFLEIFKKIQKIVIFSIFSKFFSKFKLN